MTIKKAKTQLEKLKAQQEALKAKIQRVENLQKAKERKKILIGAYYLEQANKDNHWDDIKSKMDSFLTRDHDRLLFGLSPKTVTSEQEG